MKRYVKILIPIIVIVVVAFTSIFIYKHYKKSENPLAQLKYNSRDSFYTVFEKVKNVKVIDNALLTVVTKDIKKSNDEAYLLFTAHNNSDSDIRVTIDAWEINGIMHYGSEEYYCAAGEKKECTLSLFVTTAPSEIDRLSFCFQYETESSRAACKYIRIYPNKTEAFEFVPPDFDFSELICDEKGILLAIGKPEEDAGALSFPYFLYNGANSVIFPTVDLAEINGLANYLCSNEDLDTYSEEYMPFITQGVLPGAYIDYIANTDMCDIDGVGFGEFSKFAFHYMIKGTDFRLKDTVALYPYGKDAYKNHQYEYDSNDVVLYADSNCQIRSICCTSDDAGGYISQYLYIENRTNSKLQGTFSIYRKDGSLYDAFDFLTLSSKDTIMKTWVKDSELSMHLEIYNENGDIMVAKTVYYELPTEEIN